MRQIDVDGFFEYFWKFYFTISTSLNNEKLFIILLIFWYETFMDAISCIRSIKSVAKC